MDTYPGGFTIASQGNVRIYQENGTLVKSISSYNPGNLNVAQATGDGQDIWIADLSAGLIHGVNTSDFIKLNLPGPYTNNVIYLTNSNGKTFIAGGAIDNAWNNQWRPLQVFVNEKNSWQSVISYDISDAMRVLPDPGNVNHYFVSTWGAGLLEYENENLIHKYDDSNSPLHTIIPGRPYSRICGLAIDKSGNIWITQTGMPGSIKVFNPALNTWITNPYTIDAPTIGDIMIARNGYKWVVLPRGYGLFVFDDNNTPDVFTDDRFKMMLVKDSENKIISNVYSVAEDFDGNIWIGTDQGPLIYYNPDQVFDDNFRAFKIKVPRNDGTGLADYMLGTETITTIAVDGANRKWLGTSSSGAYLLSADGTQKLVNYTEENSPMLANSIQSIAIDGKTGEIWFGTDKGVISFRGNATTGADKFTNVYTFPNPVRESFTGNVTITGLMRNTQIRITDISGNLVYETVSDGGQASWDLKTFNRRRVSTGVYLVFCASEDGSDSFVTKMLVIK
jgi:streptogramin lyase